MQIQKQDAELQVLIPKKEGVFYVEGNYSPKNAEENIQKSSACFFTIGGGSGAFSVFGKVTAALGAVTPEEIKIKDSDLVFRPYWRVKGAYACRYKRRHNHRLELEDDVEAVSIYGKDQYIVQEKTKLSDLLGRIASDTGIDYGGLKVSLSVLEGQFTSTFASVLGSKDKEIKRKVELEISEIIETAAYSFTGSFLFDPCLQVDNKDMFEALNHNDFQPAQMSALKRRGTVTETTFDLDRVIAEVKAKLCQKPQETPHEIIEQIFSISEASLIYVPFYDLTLNYRGKAKKVRLNALNCKITPL